jgi:endonuclease III
VLKRAADTTEVIDAVYGDDGPRFQQNQLPVFYRDDGEIVLKGYASTQAYIDNVVRPTASYFHAPRSEEGSMYGLLYGLAAQQNTNKRTVRDLDRLREDLRSKGLRGGEAVARLHDASYLNDVLHCADFHRGDRFSDVLGLVHGDALEFREYYEENPHKAREELVGCDGIGYKTATMIGVNWDAATDQVPMDVWVSRQMVGMGVDIDVTAAYNKARNVKGRKRRPARQPSGEAYKAAESRLVSATKNGLSEEPALFEADGLNGRLTASFYWSASRLAKAGRLGQLDVTGDVLYGSIYG